MPPIEAADDVDAHEPALHYWHGTRAHLQRGDIVEPRAQCGGAATTAPLTTGEDRLPESASWAYVTTDHYVAWAYAYMSGENGDPERPHS